MRLRSFVHPFLILIFLQSSAVAEQTYSFEKILKSAISTHPLMGEKKYASQAAKFDLSGAEWLRYPSLSIESSRADGEDDESVLFKVEQPLWTGGRITSAIDAAEKRYEASTEAISEIELDLTMKVIMAYAETMRQKARLKHARVSLAEHRKLLGLMSRRVEQEVSSLADKQLTESRLYQAIGDEVVAVQAYRNALTQLSQLSGETVSDISELKEYNSGLPEKIDEILELAMAYSPALRRINYEIEASNSDISSKQSAYMPQLSLEFESASGQVNDNKIMLMFKMAPGAGLSALSGVDSAIAQRNAIRMSQESEKRNIKEKIILSWNALMGSKMRIESAMKYRIRTKGVFESYKRQYVIGKKTWIDVLNAVREAAQSEYLYEDTRSQMTSSYLLLSSQCGLLN